jgi:long-chain acyl-CoA synthetase
MDKIWLQSYPPGMPAEINPDQYSSLVQLLEESFSKFADRNAFVCMDKFLTYRELDACSKKLAAWLQSRGLTPGARVALMMPNVLQYPIALAAVLRAGYVVVNVNPLYTARELEHQITDSGAEAIIVLENFAHTVQKVMGKTPLRHVVVANMGELLGGAKGMLVNLVVRHVKKMVPEFSLPNMVSFKDALAQGARMTFKPATLKAGDVAFLQYTGGTTGPSKGATLTHRNVIANVLQSEAWSAPALGEAGGEPLTIVCALPLYHIFALTACAMWGMRMGALNVLIVNPRDIPGFVKELAKYRVNMLPAVNTLYNALVNNSDFAHLDFSGLRICKRPWPTNGAISPAWPSSKAMACPRRRQWPPATAPTCWTSLAPSACRCHRPTSPSSTMPATRWRWARAARSRSAARKSCRDTGTSRPKPPGS